MDDVIEFVFGGICEGVTWTFDEVLSDCASWVKNRGFQKVTNNTEPEEKFLELPKKSCGKIIK